MKSVPHFINKSGMMAVEKILLILTQTPLIRLARILSQGHQQPNHGNPASTARARALMTL
jgi:hypothetical protein